MPRISSIPDGVGPEQLLFDAATQGMNFAFPYIPVTEDGRVGLKVEEEAPHVTAPIKFPLALVDRNRIQHGTPEGFVAEDIQMIYPELSKEDIATGDADILGIQWTQNSTGRFYLPYILDLEVDSTDAKIDKHSSTLLGTSHEIVWTEFSEALEILQTQFEAEDHDDVTARYRPLKMMRRFMKNFTVVE